jgi:hypothetical protein
VAGAVTGDFAKLLKFAKKVGNLAGQNAMTAVSSAMADATIELIDEGFEQEREPSGKPWREKAFPDGKPVLEQSGQLRKSFRKKQVSSRGFTVGSDNEAFKFAQYGTGVYGRKRRRIKPKGGGALAWSIGGRTFFASSVAGAPKRLMLPVGGRVPTLWRQRLNKRAKTRLLEIFNGR